MYVVQFIPPRAREYDDPRSFEQRIGKWLVFREAENCYLLGCLSTLMAHAAQHAGGVRISERMFTVEEGETLLSAAILFENGSLAMTWADEQVAATLAEFMFAAGCAIRNIYAPGYLSWKFAEKWAHLTGQRFELGRSERIYQLARCSYAPPASGQLQPAVQADKPFLMPWIDAFIAESGFQTTLSHQAALDELVSQGTLYLWKNPGPVSMAAWLSPTPNGGSINFVYTPPEFRGQGHGKAVVSALGSLMLARGRKYCFILTDVKDPRSNGLYQSIGARTHCEWMHCAIHPRVPQTSVIGTVNRALHSGSLAM